MSEVEGKNTAQVETVVTETVITETVTETDAVVAEVATTTTEIAEATVTTEDVVVEGETSTEAVETETKVEETVEEEVVIEDIESGPLHKRSKPSKPFGFGWSERWFFFSENKYESSKLKAIIKKGSGNHILHGIAHATQTGKGLLFYAHNSKSTEPQGIIVLSQVTSVEPSSGNKPAHQFKISTKHHAYELAAPSEKDLKRWIQTIKKKVEEAKELAIEETEAFKAELEKLTISKPTFGLSPPLSPITKTPKTEAKVETAESGAEVVGETVTVVTETITTEPITEVVTETTKIEESPGVSAKIVKRRSLFGNPFGGRYKKDVAEPPLPTVETKTDEEVVVAEASAEVVVTETVTEIKVEETEEIKAEAEEVKAEEVKVEEVKVEEVKVEEVKVEEVKTEEVKTEGVKIETEKRKLGFAFWPKKTPPVVVETKVEEAGGVESSTVEESATETTVAVVEVKEEAVTAVTAVTETQVTETTEVTETEVTETTVVTEGDVTKIGESSKPILDVIRKPFGKFFYAKKSEEKKPEEPKPNVEEEPVVEEVAKIAETIETEITTIIATPTVEPVTTDIVEEKPPIKTASGVTITRRLTSIFKQGGKKSTKPTESASEVVNNNTESTPEDAKVEDKVEEEVKVEEEEVKVEEVKTEEVKDEIVVKATEAVEVTPEEIKI